jgi:hypothetical protein
LLAHTFSTLCRRYWCLLQRLAISPREGARPTKRCEPRALTRQFMYRLLAQSRYSALLG